MQRRSTQRRTVELACTANDPALARRALAEWLAARWQVSQQTALAAVRDEPAIIALTAAVFSQTQERWRGDALRAWLQRVPPAAPTRYATTASSALPPLYPGTTPATD